MKLDTSVERRGREGEVGRRNANHLLALGEGEACVMVKFLATKTNSEVLPKAIFSLNIIRLGSKRLYEVHDNHYKKGLILLA